MNLPKLTDLKVADYWFEKLIDASPWYLDLTTGILQMLDDYENPAGTKYWGVDVFSSILVPARTDAALLKVSVSVKNDADTCNRRLVYLNMRDSEGKLVLSNERLVSMGWGVLKNHDLPDGDDVGQLWHDDNVELFIDRTTGKITKYMVQDMTTLKNHNLEEGFANGQRYGADNMERVIINIPQEGREEAVDYDVTNCEWMGRAKTGCGVTHICFVFKNLERINPIQIIYDKQKVANIHRHLWKPRIAFDKATGRYSHDPIQQEIPGESEFGYYPILKYLIRDLGLSEKESSYRKLINDYKYDKSVPQIKSILGLLNPPLDWTFIKDFVHHNFLELELDVMTSPDRIVSERTSYLSLFHEALMDYCGRKVFISRIMDLLLLSYTHCLFGTSRANTEYFIIPGNTIKEQPRDGLGNEIPTSEWDHTKRSLAIFLDHRPYTSSPQGSLIAIPVFKEGSGMTQLTSIDEIFERQHKQSSPAIPIQNREELVYGNVEYYLLYRYDPSDLENPYKPYSNIINPRTNIFDPDDVKMGGMNEICKFLRIMHRVCQLTNSYGRPGQENYARSAAAFLKELEGLMMNYPEAGLKIFEALGGFEAMNKIREFYPLHPLTNTQQQGLIIAKEMFSDLFKTIDSKTANEKEKIAAQKRLDELKTNSPEAWAFYEILPETDWIPTDINGFIFLLSIIGAERVGGNIYIPMKWYESNNFFAFSVKDKVEQNDEGVAKFSATETEFNKLDDIGIPMKMKLDKNGQPAGFTEGRRQLEPFKDELGNKKGFSQLTSEERGQVVAINLKENVDPYLIKCAFGGKIRINGRMLVEAPEGTNPTENCLEWYKAVTRCQSIRTGGRPAALYACWKFIAGEYYDLKLDVVKDKSKLELLDYVAEKFHTLIPVEIAKMWEHHTVTHKEVNILRSILQLYILIDATGAISETKVANDFGGKRRGSSKEDTFYINLINKLTEEVKSGNVYEITAIVFKDALTYVANELGKNPNTAVQGFMLYNLIKLGSVASAIDSLRPEHVSHASARVTWQTELAKVMTEKIALTSENLKKYGSGKTANSLYGQELVAMLEYEGATDKEITQITGFTPEEINSYRQQWSARCDREKIDERAMQEIFVSALDKICQIANFKFIDAVGSTLMMGGSMALNSLQLAGRNVIPFLMIFAPIMQAIGYIATSYMEGQTIHPLAVIGNETYYGGLVTQMCMDPSLNMLTSIIMSFAVYLTDYMEFGCGPFVGSGYAKVGKILDLDYINVILAGCQGAMINLGLSYVSEDTIADLMKPLFGVAGLISMLPQVDQFYKTYIWPGGKLVIGAALMGGVKPLITSALANIAAINTINAAENAFINSVMGTSFFDDVTFDWSALTNYLPGFGGGGYDYLSNYITHHVWGVW
ncbi:MAG: hypothetical protein Q6366_012085 [Candidatus Freyarchaeota archaeon]